MKSVRRKIVAILAAMAMILTMLPTVIMASNEGTPNGNAVFCQFYSQNQGGNWEWMSTTSAGLTLNQPTKMTFAAVDSSGQSIFAVATEEANFGFEFGDGGLTVGDQSEVSIKVEPIIIKATGYEDLVIEASPSQITSNFLAKEVDWGIDGNATMISLKKYLGDDFINYLHAITSIETTVTLTDYKFTPKEDQEQGKGEKIYSIGDMTELFCQYYAQNQGGGWEWMSPASEKLIFGEKQSITFSARKEDGSSIFKVADDTAVFGFQFADGGIKAGESSKVKFNIEQMTIKADGYEDLVIEPQNYEVSYLAEEVSWGIQGNATFIKLTDYIKDDFLAHLNAITSMEVTLTVTDYEKFAKPEEAPEFDPNYVPPTTMRGLTANEIVAEMGMGWNLGNTLDSRGGETAWGNPKTTKKMIDEIKKAGFNTLRVPITWDDNLGEGPEFLINEEYLKRVETVVNYGLANDMYVIVNIHHSYGWDNANKENEELAKAEMAKIWGQIADRFKDYGDQLIFETLNEPRDGNDWTGYQEAYEVINAFNATCLDTIRTSGGNNAKRMVMMPGYAAASNEASIKALKVPDDQYVAVSIHAYLPYSFALDITAGSQTTWNSVQEKKVLENTFKLLKDTFLDKGIPVVIGEFGSVNKNNLEARISHAKDYVSLARQYGMPCAWWDNGVAESETGEALGLFDRRTLTWTNPEILKALFEGYNNPNNEESDPLLVFKGRATSNGSWGQAIKLTPGSDFLISDLIPNSQIAVTYTSNNRPELILQSWSGGPSWLQVAPSEVKDGVAYFDYEDLVKGYGKDFSNLNQMYIGDTGAALEVTKIQIVHSIVEGEFLLYGQWPNGVNGQVTFTNLGKEAITDWKISLEYEGEITNLWNGVIESHEGNRYVIKNAGWNQSIAPGQDISIGWISSGDKASEAPIKYHLVK